MRNNVRRVSNDASRTFKCYTHHMSIASKTRKSCDSKVSFAIMSSIGVD
jgi:hypothetical protein